MKRNILIVCCVVFAMFIYIVGVFAGTNVAEDGFPTGQDTPEGVACDAIRAYINSDHELWISLLVPPIFGEEKDKEYEQFKKDMVEKKKQNAKDPNFPKMKIDRTLGLPHGPRASLKRPYGCRWEYSNPPLLVRAMVSTRDCLFVAGPKDIMDEKAYSYRDASKGYGQLKSDLKRQSDIWNGQGGGLLHALSKKDGARLAEHKLDAIPVFDGMIAVEGKLFVSLTSGDLICLRGSQEKGK